MTKPDLSSVAAKIDRGFEHLDALDAEIERFIRRYPYGFRHDVKEQGRHHTGHLDFFLPIPERVGVLIGDSAHAFRCALDNLVYAVARVTLNDSDFAKWESSLAFPICTEERFFKDAIDRHRLEGVTGKVRDIVADRQPYKTDDPPQGSYLIRLAALDDRDKHRLVTPVQGYAMGRELNFRPPLIAGKHRLTVYPGIYTGDKADVFDLTLDEPNAKMDVYLDVTLRVFVREGPDFQDVREMLKLIGQNVQRIAFEINEAAKAQSI